MPNFEFKLPDIGEGVVEAELLRWRVAEGERVREDQVLAELETDKASIEIPSPRTGRIVRRHFAEGETVPVGAILVEIDEGLAPEGEPAEMVEAAARVSPAAASAETAGETPAARVDGGETRELATPRAPEFTGRPPALPARPGRPRAAGGAGSGVAGPESRQRAVPAVRELARRRGVDLERIAGSGPGGRVMRRDVEAAARAVAEGRPLAESRPPAAPELEDQIVSVEAALAGMAAGERIPLRGVRRRIAERLRHSQSTAVHFTYVDEVDLTGIMAGRKVKGRKVRGREAAGCELSPLAFIAEAVVAELANFSRLNASLDDPRQEIVIHPAVNLGIATATEAGLVVPVIHEANRLGLEELAERIAEVSQAARQRELPPEALAGSTFTISSLGKLGGLLATPVINWPEVAILSVHAIRVRPRYVAGELAPRSVANLALSCDHRVIDGIDAARFVEAVKHRLEDRSPDVSKEGGADGS